MTLSADRIALANLTIQRTFEQASVAWQSIPHWETGDPGQVKVRSDDVVTLKDLGSGTVPPVPEITDQPLGAGVPLDITPTSVEFLVTLAQATAATPDALLAAVIPRTVALAKKVDAVVLPKLAEKAAAVTSGNFGTAWYPELKVSTPAIPATTGNPATAATTVTGPEILKQLVYGRALLEDSGFHSPSCLVADTAHFTDLNGWQNSNVVTEGLLVGANANSLHRSSTLDANTHMLMIGRRQEIAHGRAATATPGEEPVDLAVSVAPSLEVVGENAQGQIQLAVRIRYALRFKDERGVVVFHHP